MDPSFLSSFLEPVSSQRPAGDNLYDNDPDYQDLELSIRSVDSDPAGTASVSRWKTVRDSILQLMRRTRDIRLNVYLVRALLHTDGYPGLVSGLSLLDDTLKQFWDTLYPELDVVNDPTERINILQRLCDYNQVLYSLVRLPLVELKGVGSFALRDLQLALNRIPLPTGYTRPDVGLIESAFKSKEPEYWVNLISLINQGIERLRSIEQSCATRLNGSRPSLDSLDSMLKEGDYCIRKFMESSGMYAVADDSTNVEFNENSTLDEAPVSTQTGGIPVARPVAATVINTRHDVQRSLDTLCAYYQEYEPSSPVPLLLKRAGQLVDMDFMDIIRNLAPAGLSEVEKIRGPDT
jgi:type VI secretion system protein ImpA